MNKRQAKKMARNHWKRFFAKELTRCYIPKRKIKPCQVNVKEEHTPDNNWEVIKITGSAYGREMSIRLLRQFT